MNGERLTLHMKRLQEKETNHRRVLPGAIDKYIAMGFGDNSILEFFA